MSAAIEPKRKTKKQQKADAHKQSRSARKNARLETLQDVPEEEADEDAAPVVKASKSKKRKAVAVNGEDEEAAGEPKAKKVKVKAEVVPPPRAQRWICFCGKLRIRGVPPSHAFVGNLPFDATEESLQEYFKTEDGAFALPVQCA
jgi:hypothetical protein